MPVGLRKSGIPDSVETPAPVKTTTGPPATISSAARSISSVRSLIVGSDPRAYQREPAPRPRIRPTVSGHTRPSRVATAREPDGADARRRLGRGGDRRAGSGGAKDRDGRHRAAVGETGGFSRPA